MLNILTKLRVNQIFIFFMSLFLLMSCKEGKNDSKDQETTVTVGNDTVPRWEQQEASIQLEEYTSAKWGLALEYPEHYEVFEGQLPGKAHVINVYEKKVQQSPPFGIHEDASLAYITILPGGYGVDAPAGEQMTFLEWPKNLPLSFEIDKQESIVYLLESGEPWAYNLRFHSSPGSWNEYGLIFIHLKIHNYRTACFGKDGKEKPMQACDPLIGDEIKHFGDTDAKSRNELHKILSSIYFFEENPFREPIEEFIQIQHPQEEAKISSPLKITGQAKGYWFFEGTAPFKVVDEDYRILGSGSLEAGEDWMTEGLVPFTAEVEFTSKEQERGYIIFNRANPSGRPTNDRVYELPVKFK